jgi:hypothetical protein
MRELCTFIFPYAAVIIIISDIIYTHHNNTLRCLVLVSIIYNIIICNKLNFFEKKLTNARH